MSKIDLHGIFPPIPTPFVNGRIVYDGLAANIEKWRKTGLKGLVAMGSNGEYVYLSGEEKREFVAKVVAMTPDPMQVIAGTGCESTKETIELTRDCADIGAHAALVVSPHYYGGRMNEAALHAHFTTVADHSPIPILLYNVPKFTHINMTCGLVARLSRHPNIVGIKDSTGNVSQLGEYANHVAADFNLLVGTAGALFGALALGCVGGVLALANVAPQICVEIYRLVQEGGHGYAGIFRRRSPAAAFARFGEGEVRNQGNTDKGRSVGSLITSNIHPNVATLGFAIVGDDRNRAYLG